MMKKQLLLLIIGAILFTTACNRKAELADAYGNFETEDQMVTSELAGKLLSFDIEEGISLKAGEVIGQMDTVQLHLKKLQVKASISAIKGKLQDIRPQIRLLEKKIEVMTREKNRVIALLKDEAATQKQLDDIQGQLDILTQQIESSKSQSKIANRALLAQIAPLEAQLLQIDDQLDRCSIKNPINGSVLLKLAEVGEMISPQKPLYQIADLSNLALRAYISGDQLAQINLGKEVQVEIDQSEKDNISLKGKIIWISDKAEFTPKTIQTKEERVNLVYAFKVKVDNKDGLLKIGMPGEVWLTERSTEETE